MVVKPWCFDVVIRGRITAVGHIGHEVVVLGIVAPPPPAEEAQQEARPRRRRRPQAPVAGDGWVT